jgi:hypothetical protein
MKNGRFVLSIVLLSSFALPAIAAGSRSDFDAKVGATIVKLSREAVVDTEAAARLAGLLEDEFGTSIEDMKWAVDESLSWGDISAFAYIAATTGRSFREIGSANAQRDLWDYTDKAGMNSEKMVGALERLLKRVETVRNTRIFERLRGSRKVTRLPDLGSGFGLFQEALDFRHIDNPRPDKVLTTTGPVLAKGEK